MQDLTPFLQEQSLPCRQQLRIISIIDCHRPLLFSQQNLQAYRDQTLLIGIRPEHIAPVNPDQAHITLKLKAVEALGHEQLLYFDINTHQAKDSNLIVRYTGNPGFAIGDEVPLRIDGREVYFFDQQGVAILSGA